MIFQCFTHRYLGWKINVLDACDETEGEASHLVETIVAPEGRIQQDPLRAEESIQVSTRVKPDNNFIVDQRRKAERVINTKPTYDDYNNNNWRHPFPENPHDADTLTGEIMFHSEPSKNVLSLGANQLPEYELPISKVQIKQVIEAVESLESQMRDDLGKPTLSNTPHKQNIYLENKDPFLLEQPVREDEEYSIESGKLPVNFMLPPNQKPLTLQSVMRPNGKPPGPMRPFRRPTPPEIKLRRPPYMKPGMGYHPKPNHMTSYGGTMPSMKKPIHKQPNNRLSPPNRPPMGSMTPPNNMNSYHGNKPLYHSPPQRQNPKPVQSIIMGKPVSIPPSQTLNLGQTNIIGTHVVQSQISLPNSNEPTPQHSVPQTYFSKPGQIILGKPMENPVLLDQQMIQTKSHSVHLSPTVAPEINYPSTTQTLHDEDENRFASSNTDMKSSDSFSESKDTSVLFQPAVNTGFKPDSIVIESGFKPIIREPLMASEDKITDFGIEIANRRQDSDVEEDYEEAPQYISNHAYTGSEKHTETFEPMFIPSPPDHLLPTNDRTKEVFPSNHAKEDRPHPIYVKTETELNSLFSKKNMEKEAPLEMTMEADRVSAQYLPPDPKLPKEHSQKLSTNDQTFTTYDGKTVSAITLTETNKNITKLFSSKLPANSELLLKTPQFGPFKGEIPPVIAEQLDKNHQSNEHHNHDFHDKRTTQLKLVNSLHESNLEDIDELKPEESEVHETIESDKIDDDETDEEYDEEDNDENDDVDGQDGERIKRDIKVAHFEARQLQETSTMVDRSQASNHIEFDNHVANASTRDHCWTLHSLLLVLLLRYF